MTSVRGFVVAALRVGLRRSRDLRCDRDLQVLERHEPAVHGCDADRVDVQLLELLEQLDAVLRRARRIARIVSGGGIVDSTSVEQDIAVSAGTRLGFPYGGMLLIYVSQFVTVVT